MATRPPQLDYGPPPPIHRQRRWRRAALLIVLLACVACGWEWGPEYWAKTKFLYVQRQCLTYVAPPDQVVYESDPARFAALASQTPEYATLLNWARAKRLVRTPQCWAAFEAMAYPRKVMARSLRGPFDGTLFLHELKAPDGKPILVRVGYTEPSNDPAFIPGFDVTEEICRSATWSTPVKELTPAYVIDVMSRTDLEPPMLRFFAGQPDAADPSHFTIRYQAWGQEDVLDGRVEADGRVSLKPRNRPEAPRDALK